MLTHALNRSDMRIVKIMVLVFLSFGYLPFYAQNEAYVVGSNASLHLVDVLDCTAQYIGVLDNAFFDIAYSPIDSVLYGVDSYGNLYSIDVLTAEQTFIGYAQKGINALTFSDKGVLYAMCKPGDESLYTVSTMDGHVTSLGNTGVFSAGDLTFYHDSLYLARDGDDLVQINIQVPSSSKILGEFLNMSNIYGITTVGCESVIYAFAGNDIYKLNHQNLLLATLQCSNIIGISVYGAAAVNETVNAESLELGPDTTLCQGQSFWLNATAPNASYIWPDGSNGPTFHVDSSGKYWVEWTISNCTFADTINVAYNPLPELVLYNDTTLCQGDTLILDMTLPNASYLWQDNSTDPVFEVTQQGTYWVEVTLGNCSSTDSIIVDYSLLPEIDLGQDTSLCPEQTLDLNAGLPGGSYLWQDNSTDSIFTVSEAGTFRVEVSLNNCTSTDSIHVVYIELPESGLFRDTVLCTGDTLILDVSTPNASYLWQDNSTDHVFTVKGQGLYWVEVNVSSCSMSDTVFIAYNPLPMVDLGADTSLCLGDILTLNASLDNASFMWQDTSSHPTYVVSQQGTFWVEVTAENCISSDTVNIKYIHFPTDNLLSDTTLCQNEMLTFDVSMPDASYNWQDNSNDPVFVVSQEGIYWVEVSIGNCSISDSSFVKYSAFPYFDLGPDLRLCFGDEVVLDASAQDASYMWQDSSTAPAFIVQQPGNFWVEVSNYCGTASDTIMAIYEDCNCFVFFPNAFTPNKDGLNDDFGALSTCVLDQSDLTILNRWGQAVFNGRNVDKGWDGTFLGQDMPAGVYIYLFRYKLKSGEIKELKGSVSLIR
jgi:gliding motility-associated-like protein